MTRPLVLLRPQPGNDRSAKRAIELGMSVAQVPLFDIVAAVKTDAPNGPFDAILVTSANGVHFGGDELARFAGVPIYTVGEATAQAIRSLGHRDVIVGGGDAASTVPLIAAAGHGKVLHLCGADVRPFDPMGVRFIRHVVYGAAMRADADVRPVLDAIEGGVIAVHSPRAGSRIAGLIEPGRRGPFHLLAISAAAASASGDGWSDISVSARPDDTALLTLAESLCNCGD
jgi:uroporphyrinogen-III synthase